MGESALTLSTRDGALPVRVFHPDGAPSKGGVIFYMDAFGMRPEFDEMCRRYARVGYATFLPDLYHRLGKLRFPPPRHAGEPLDAKMDAANNATSIEMSLADTAAILDHAAQELQITRFGAVGHCMGARHALAALAAYPEAVKAAACLHGGKMVWDGATSPHLRIPEIKGVAYFAFAADDPTCPQAHQALIERTIEASGVRATTEHFAAAHGWTFPERPCYDRDAAELVWARVVALFDREFGGAAAKIVD